jgi:1-acyl-sn-glycerol-3-phosphate acyltransferase
MHDATVLLKAIRSRWHFLAFQMRSWFVGRVIVMAQDAFRRLMRECPLADGGEGKGAVYVLKYVILGPWIRLIFRPKVEGREYLPDTGAAIIASNHLSFSDSIFMPLMVKRKGDLRREAGVLHRQGSQGLPGPDVLRRAGTIPVDRSVGRAAQAAIDTGLRVLREGRLFGIYPEGTRSPDGRLHRGKTGVARLALESGAPVIPVAMLNADEIQPPARFCPRSSGCGSASARRWISPAMPVWPGDRFIERAVTDEIMYELMTLSGREYVDIYAQKVKAAKEAKALAPAPATPADIAA